MQLEFCYLVVVCSAFHIPRLKEITNHKDVGEMKARVYLNLGLVMETQDRTDKAIEYLEKVFFLQFTDYCIFYFWLKKPLLKALFQV